MEETEVVQTAPSDIETTTTEPEIPAVEKDDVDGTSQQQPAAIPDGGLAAWLQVLGSWVVMVATWGLVNTFGVYQTYYETVLLVGRPGGSSSAISWIGSLQAALLMLVGVVAGPLFDAGYFRPLLLVGLLLVVLGQLLTSWCKAYWQLVLAQGLAVGLGMGLSFLPATAVLGQYFARRRALAIGIASTGSPLAGVVFPLVFSHLQPRLGAAWATRIIALILLGLTTVPAAFMHTRVVVSGPSPGGGTAPDGTVPDGTTPDGTTPDGTTPDGKPQQAQQQLPPRRSHRRPLIDASALREIPFVVATLGGFCAFLCAYVPFFFLQLFAERRGIFNAALSPFHLVTLLNVGSIFGRVVPNALADRFGSINLMVLCCVFSAALLFAWLGIAADTAGLSGAGTGTGTGAGSHYLGGTVAFALLYGLFSGGIVSLIPSIIFVLTSDLTHVGTRMGMLLSVTGLAILVGPPIAGAILGDGSVANRWMHTIGFAAAGLGAAALFFALSRGAVYRQRAG